MTDYVLCKLGLARNNAFLVDFSLNLPIHDEFVSGIAKIDTGCEGSNLSLASSQFAFENLVKLKQDAVVLNLFPRLGYGANDSLDFRQRESSLFDTEHYMECTAVSFRHPVKNFILGGCFIPVHHLSVSYDRVSFPLIGMDILKYFDFHCGESLIDDEMNKIQKGDYIFLGCWKTAINGIYLKALEDYLGYFNATSYKAKWFLKWLSHNRLM